MQAGMTAPRRVAIVMLAGLGLLAYGAGLVALAVWGGWSAAEALLMLLGGIVLLLQMMLLRATRRTHAAATRASRHASKATARAIRAVDAASSGAKRASSVITAMEHLSSSWGQMKLELIDSGRLTQDNVSGLMETVHLHHESVLERFATVEARLARTESMFSEHTGSLNVCLTQVANDMKSEFRRAERNAARISTNDYAQLEALLSLREAVPHEQAAPPLRGWAAAPTTMLAVIDLVTTEQPDLVVECGSGASSVWIGEALRHRGFGRCVSLEHDPSYYGETLTALKRRNLQDFVDLRLAPLVDVEIDGRKWRWYDPRAVDDLSGIGLLFVDGPPGSTQEMARFPALPLLLSKMRPQAPVLLDDAARPDERAIADLWLNSYDVRDVSFAEAAEKGLRIIRVNS